METETLDLEEGEVVDDEPIDAFETYNVLQRPHSHIPPVSDQSNKLGYSDESDISEASESDSDSDAGHSRMKRPKIKIKRCKTISQRSANDKYKVWCTQVQEESLTEDLVSCGVTRSIFHDRAVESYDYTIGYSLGDKKSRDNNTSDEDQETEVRLTNKRTHSDRRNVKLRLGKRRKSHGEEEEEDHKGNARVLSDLAVTPESTDEEIAADIAEKLSEKKDDLIKRVVEILGKEAAIDFFERTRKIEAEGGMLIMNGSRRRTPGGIYLFLVKHDDHIPQPKIREIFYQDKREATENRKIVESTHRKQKTQELMKLLENGSDKDLPALLTRAELSTRQIAEEARLRRGEGMDRIPIDSDRTVSNPPPSPVTDDPDHTEPSNPVCSRRIQEYGEDFLDIGVEVDMEVF